MNPELMQLKGQLAVAREKCGKLELEISGLVAIIRRYLPAYYIDALSLEADKAGESMERLKVIHAELKILRQLIAKIEADLREAGFHV
ncbi:MAG: hypothetical protein RDU76_11520 [Candidatus Edwardsbacteria bacterium]|nr:hypothetical protein [Candidatus Edwardsbacteria bacterium]